MPVRTSVIAEIQAKVDLLAYVSQYVTLRKRGREYVGLCPFHAEKTPSFYLNAEKQVWHCYGCDAGGDLITFVRRYENLEFGDALRVLAARAGVVLHEAPEFTRYRSEREAIYEANAAAKLYFTEALQKSPEAISYAEQRGIDAPTLEQFQVGFAPDDWEGLTAALRRARIDPELAVRAGLLSKRQSGGYCDFFRRRLMFPVFNLTSEVIAFGGRALGDEQPKYLNTRNTAVYTKGQHVYALQVARKAAAAREALIVVEGYLDCLALHQAGFANAVASLGTAFTIEQARELRRVAANLFLCFDGDAAGQSATARSIDMLVEEGLLVRVAQLTEGRDPDDIVAREGAEAFQRLLDDSLPWVDFKIDLACRRISARFSSKSDIAKQAMAIITQVRDPIERDQYIKAMARKLEVDESALRQVRPPVTIATRSTNDTSLTHRRAPGPPLGLSVERELLQLLLVRSEFIAPAAERISLNDFSDQFCAATFAKLCARGHEITAGVNPLTILADDADEATVAQLTRLALESPPLTLEEDERRLARVLERFERARLERRLSSVDAEMNRLLVDGKSVPEPLRDEYNLLATTLRGSTLDRKEGS